MGLLIDRSVSAKYNLLSQKNGENDAVMSTVALHTGRFVTNLQRVSPECRTQSLP